MKLLVSIGAFLVGLATFTASALSIVDYALNKPEVVDTVLGPVLAVYHSWILEPTTQVVVRVTSSEPTPSEPAPQARQLVTLLILLLAGMLVVATAPRALEAARQVMLLIFSLR